MRRDVQVGLWVIAWVSLLVAGCTTGFELQTRPADVPTDRGVAVDQGADAGPAMDAPDDVPTDTPPVDVPVPGCREPGDRCCADAMRGAFCTAGLVCSEGYCARCPGALFACGNACVDLQTSGRHCGSCGAACADGQRCVGGSCVADCPASAAVCDSRCVNLQEDSLNCGACGRACAPTGVNTLSRCRAGACQVSCQVGFDDCDNNPTNGCETDTRTSAAHCGACGQACAPNRAAGRCEAGACTLGTCNPGFANCDGMAANGCEVDLARDRGHCGACNRACGTMQACEASVCVASACLPGTAECVPGDPACETSTNTSVTNCGACGRTCAFANALAVCESGTCRLDACLPGFFDCDAVAANGCERRVANDLMNCGACGNVCAAPNGTPFCRGGSCHIDSCNEGFLDCDGLVANGCEVDSRTSLSHCGGCGQACAAPNVVPVCSAGRCGIASCAPGFRDCDDNGPNGCEVNVNTDPLNCGRCGSYCAFANAASSCAGGACVLGACSAGYANCDGVAGNGCETDTRANTSHCGGCGQACSFANATATCTGGACGLGVCATNYGNCDNNPANGCETDTRSSGAHCGACGRACAAGNICSNGTCVLSCPPGQTVCAGACVDLNTNVNHCRACGNVCTAGAHQTAGCASGTCVRRCEDNYADCDNSPANGCEVHLPTDSTHCGECRVSCENPPNAAGYCDNGTCGYLCQRTYGDCDGNSSNGCEAAFETSMAHCGGCNQVCPAASTLRLHLTASACTEGRCMLTCDTNWADCDNDVSNGCEQSLFDTTHCGSCNNVCSTVVGGDTAVCCRPVRMVSPACCVRNLGQIICPGGIRLDDSTCR